MIVRLLALPLLSCGLALAGWVNLSNGKNLDGWEAVGDGVWTMMHDGTILGQRDLSQPIVKARVNQSWLYTKKEFRQYDLHVEWWTRLGGNSGVSLRDRSRARYTFGPNADPVRTPSHLGYEIQISEGYKDQYPSGSVYLFEKAKEGFQHNNDWNVFDIEVRDSGIRVKLNGHLVSESAGDPKRSKTGPIGLQLHDRTSIAMFRNIRIQEVP
ncbi:MAG: 3-keto-disaccharide hydrolase [Bryobacteraceae bacterium]